MCIPIARPSYRVVEKADTDTVSRVSAFLTTLYVAGVMQYHCGAAAGVLRVASTRIIRRCRHALSHLSARTLPESLDQWPVLFRRLSSFILYTVSKNVVLNFCNNFVT